MATTLKIAELKPTNQFEPVSDSDLEAIHGGEGFQLVIGSTSATTGAAIGGRVQNSTNSFFTLNGGVGSDFFSASVQSTAISTSFPF
ncbi:hypothetical protein NUACC21_37460 [Scytonema sp. NUACC21]